MTWLQKPRPETPDRTLRLKDRALRKDGKTDVRNPDGIADIRFMCAAGEDSSARAGLRTFRSEFAAIPA